MENSVYENKHTLLNETILFFFSFFRMNKLGMNVLLKLVYMSVLYVWYLWLNAR